MNFSFKFYKITKILFLVLFFGFFNVLCRLEVGSIFRFKRLIGIFKLIFSLIITIDVTNGFDAKRNP